MSIVNCRLALGMKVEFILKLVAVDILRSSFFHPNSTVSFFSIATTLQFTGRSFPLQHYIHARPQAHLYTMYFSTALVLALAGAACAAPSTENKPRQQQGQFDASDPDFLSLIPEFGVQQGVNPTGTGDCDGFNAIANKVVPINCDKCPPPRDAYVQQLAKDLNAGNVFGNPVTFNKDPATANDAQANKDRATACLTSLQSFYGSKGVGCPAVAAPNMAKQQVTGVRDDQQFIPQAGGAGGASAAASANTASASGAARKRKSI